MRVEVRVDVQWRAPLEVNGLWTLVVEVPAGAMRSVHVCRRFENGHVQFEQSVYKLVPPAHVPPDTTFIRHVITSAALPERSFQRQRVLTRLVLLAGHAAHACQWDKISVLSKFRRADPTDVRLHVPCHEHHRVQHVVHQVVVPPVESICIDHALHDCAKQRRRLRKGKKRGK